MEAKKSTTSGCPICILEGFFVGAKFLKRSSIVTSKFVNTTSADFNTGSKLSKGFSLYPVGLLRINDWPKSKIFMGSAYPSAVANNSELFSCFVGIADIIRSPENRSKKCTEFEFFNHVDISST